MKKWCEQKEKEQRPDINSEADMKK